MKVLITGGAGFIGSHYADAFAERQDDVTVFDLFPPLHEFRSTYVQGDLRDYEAVRAVVRQSDFVIHAGGILGTHETVLLPVDTTSTNIIGGLNVLQAVQDYGNNLINVSKPNAWLNPYTITKDCFEKYCFMYVHEFNVKVAILRLFNVYGPRQKYSGVRKAIPTWIVDGLSNRPMEIFGTGLSTMDLVYISDVVNATMAVVDNFDRCCLSRVEITTASLARIPGYDEQVLEVGSGVEITINATVEALSHALAIPMRVRRVPMRRGERDGTQLRANISRLASLTGYRPAIPLQEGFANTIAYYKQNMAVIQDQRVTAYPA